MTRTLYDNLIAHARTNAELWPSRAEWLMDQIAGMKAQRRYFVRINRQFFTERRTGWMGA